MGRPRKPTSELENTGQFREDRHGARRLEPRFEGEPVMPAGMPKDAQDHWRLVVPQLVAKGVATELDTAALQAMCEMWAEYRMYLRMKGKTRARQMMIASAKREWQKLAGKFGLTPSDRANLEVGEGGDLSNPFEQWLKQRGAAN